MKTFESLFAELSEKAVTKPEGSLTVDELAKGTHFIGKKIVEEAGESWIAAEACSLTTSAWPNTRARTARPKR